VVAEIFGEIANLKATRDFSAGVMDARVPISGNGCLPDPLNYSSGRKY
jgi:hypothetical protein